MKAFHATLYITSTPSEAKIYINNELKGTGSTVVILNEAKDVIVKVEKDGYITQTITYSYDNHKTTPTYRNYERGDNHLKIELQKEKKSNIDISLAKAITIDGKYVFFNCEPIAPYEIAFDFSTTIVKFAGCPNMLEITKACINSANKKEIPYDAIIIGSSKYDIAIRFK